MARPPSTRVKPGRTVVPMMAMLTAAVTNEVNVAIWRIIIGRAFTTGAFSRMIECSFQFTGSYIIGIDKSGRQYRTFLLFPFSGM